MNRRLEAIVDLENLAKEAGFKVTTLAKIAGVSREALRIYIQNRFHKTPKKWLSQLRLEETQAMLSHGQSVKEIATVVGFHHPTHFSRAFRKACGMAPRLFAADQAQR
ncbi:MAG TPA: helix-turn-helix transcriptional regulator [Candidatus Eisenbacteria bacterium]|nr:helix-turn-helix transcriptional regulator [Candidatus Eisenbacteria bacterium]